MKPSEALVLVKTLHTVVWLFFVACIVAIPVAAHLGAFDVAAWAAAAVALEVLVLVFNRWRCPLTGVAARYTGDRRENFDIYLPAWLARHNKTVFGVLFLVGLGYALYARWHSAG